MSVISCVSHNDEVAVEVFHLKSLSSVDREAPMARSEQQKRLYGAVDLKERNARMGQYYTVHWNVSEHQVTEPLRVVFLYNQTKTGAKVLSKQYSINSVARKGLCEFSVTGEDYQTGGRVLCWKIEVYSGEKLLATEQSYLWK